MAADAAISLSENWQLAFAKPGLASDPAGLESQQLEWIAAQVPGTAASALRALGRWSLDDSHDFDADEIWYRLRFSAPEKQGAEHATEWLRFAGLATLADVWLNGAHLLRAENMFLEHRVDVSGKLQSENELLIRFASLKVALAQKRPRPRWKTRLVEQQQLRWFRTTLLGRIPGWTPKCAPVGPWKGIYLETGRAPPKVSLRSSLEQNDGVVAAQIDWHTNDLPSSSARAFLEVGAARAELQRSESGFHGGLRIGDVPRWWPHTHGAQPLFPVRIVVAREGEAEQILECGKTGFRALELVRGEGNFALRINGIPCFCRGACWTTLDPVTLHGDAAGYRAALEQMTEAGMNMVRIGGTMTYEDPVFHALCDELGILVFQDFQLANLDYPIGDAAFAASLTTEAGQLLRRTQLSPSLAILCGGSEVEQQAAMLGVATNLATGPLYGELLPKLCAAKRSDVPYVTNSPTGGPLPFTVSEGLSHYYGVGAYLRPLEDARRAEVRFTSECLAFANVPEQATLDSFLGDGQVPPHHPRWKARVPRDSGAGWDFDDVRDHYLKLLFREDPLALRYADPQRYLQLSRAVTGEVMEAAFSEWRRGRSTCNGALIWFLRDLWPGAGWGVIDALGKPKPAWWFLKRALQPLALLLADEGANGLRLHLLNETQQAFAGEVRLALYRDHEAIFAEGKVAVEIPARGELELWGDALLGRFTDSTGFYKFGPPGHSLCVASLRDSSGVLRAQAFHFPLGRPSHREPELGLEAQLVRAGSGWVLRVKSRRFAQAIALEVENAVPADNWFHLEPGVERVIALRSTGDSAPRVLLEPLNGRAQARAVIP
jgi:beta-mannosidase